MIARSHMLTPFDCILLTRFLQGRSFEYNELSIQEILALCNKKFFTHMDNEKCDPRNGWFLILILSLTVFACNLPAPTASPPSSGPILIDPATQTVVPSEPLLTPTPAIITYLPSFEAAPCAFEVPRGYNPECGYLVVPENRARPDTRQIRLHVAIFRNRTGTPNVDPVLKISGGPGSSGLNTAGYLLGRGMDAVLERRDFIMFDQRGTGYSLPRLDCPERMHIAPALLGGRLSDEESAQ